MTTAWGWRPPQQDGIWKHGCAWARPFVAAAPWITLALLLAMFALLQGRVAAAPGAVFELPARIAGEAVTPDLTVLVMPMVREGEAGRETLVFFDDARYSMLDSFSVASFQAKLRERVAGDSSHSLLILADARISSGDLMRIAAIARDSGVEKVQIAEKRQ